MPIIKTYDFQDFCNEFELYNRNDHFTSEALEIIFDYLNQDDYTFNMDIVGFCCEFIEQSCADVLHDYDVCASEDMDNDELAEAAREYLHDNTSLVGEYVTDNGETVFVFVQF